MAYQVSESEFASILQELVLLWSSNLNVKLSEYRLTGVKCLPLTVPSSWVSVNYNRKITFITLISLIVAEDVGINVEGGIFWKNYYINPINEEWRVEKNKRNQ